MNIGDTEKKIKFPELLKTYYFDRTLFGGNLIFHHDESILLDKHVLPGRLNMDFAELVKRRQSTRQFDHRPVEKEKIETCLEAARLAPSAQNSQPWRFMVVQDPALLSQFKDKVFSGLYGHTGFASQAPVLIVMLAKLDLFTHVLGKQVQDINFYMLDMGIAGEHFILQAEDLGLATCWIGWFNVGETRKILKIPRGYKICSLIALGYPQPGSTLRQKKRNIMEEMLLKWY